MAENTTTEEATEGGTKITLIIPPPEVRNIVDTTANFVARNGPEFESRIRQTEINNVKFNFLKPADPYHAYYENKVKHYSENKQENVGKPIEGQAGSAPGSSGVNIKLAQDTPKDVKEVFEPKDPPPELEFMVDPPSINSLELDIVKLTAQFVARNGRQFLTNLMQREARNYLFDFLKPQHSMFTYFTKLVEQYTKILIPPKDLLAKLEIESNDAKYVLKQIKYRVDWQGYQDRQRKREEEILDRERVAYAVIDWHDFVVVETVDYQSNETGNFPPPTCPEEVGARMLAEERGEQLPKSKWRRAVADAKVDDVTEVFEYDESSEEEETTAEDSEQQPEKQFENLDSTVTTTNENGYYDPEEAVADDFDLNNAPTPPAAEATAANVETSSTLRSELADVAGGTIREELADAQRPSTDATLDSRVEEKTVEPDDMEVEEAEDMELSDEEGESRGEKSRGATKLPIPSPPAASIYDSAGAMPPPMDLPPIVGGPRSELGKGSANVVIRRDYDPKVAVQTRQASKDTVLLKSPFGDQSIPANQAASHVKIGLLDPSWVEQRERERRPKQYVGDTGAYLEQNLRLFAERRTDIFGSEETRIGQKVAAASERRPMIGPQEVPPDGEDVGMFQHIGPQIIEAAAQISTSSGMTTEDPTRKLTTPRLPSMPERHADISLFATKMTRQPPPMPANPALPVRLPLPIDPPGSLNMNVPPPPPPGALDRDIMRMLPIQLAKDATASSSYTAPPPFPPQMFPSAESMENVDVLQPLEKRQKVAEE